MNSQTEPRGAVNTEGINEVSMGPNGAAFTNYDNVLDAIEAVDNANGKPRGHCQTNLNRPARGAGPRRSGRQLAPLGQGGGTVLSEDVAAIEVTVLIEMIMDRGVDGGKLLQSFYVPKLRHRTLSSSERLM